MIARNDHSSVIVGLHPESPEVYLPPLLELEAAEAALKAHEGDLGKADLQEYKDRVAAAQADVEDLLLYRVDIRTAENYLRQLSTAITRAKVSRGDYQYDAEVIPFPFSRPLDAA